MLNWTPPDGMPPAVASQWRAFYRAALAKYGITPRQYRALYVAQRGTCYICRKATGKNPDDPKGRGGRRLGIDHNHVTGAGPFGDGQIRGLLCSGSTSANTCNRLIARYSLAALKRAVEYVETEPAQTVLRAARHADAAGLSPMERDALMRSILNLRP